MAAQRVFGSWSKQTKPMTAHIIDSTLLGDLYSTPAMRQVWNDHNRLQCWLDVEAALARAEAACEVIPAEAAEEISRHARAGLFDFEALRQEIAAATHPIVPVIRALTRLCSDDLGQYVHWGATTQDITDTGLVLQIKAAYPLLLDDLDALSHELARLAREHRDTLMVGRTHGQHALPLTFGFKVAVWLRQIESQRRQLEALRSRVLVGQLSGAVGTLAALGPVGLEVQRRVCEELGLAQPLIAWHAAREGLAAFVFAVSLLTALLGNIAHEIVTLQRTEIAEVEEPHPGTKVGSSTMPQKRNPMMCESILGLARLARQHGALALDAVASEHERDWSTIQAEWAFVGEACLLAAGALSQMRTVLTGLVVHRERMRQNLTSTGGLLLAEAVMMELAPQLGRGRAHDLVHAAAMRAVEEGPSFAESLLEQPEISAVLPREQLNRLLDPAHYVGLSAEMVDRVLANLEKHIAPNNPLAQ